MTTPPASSPDLLKVGDPNEEVTTAWHAKEAVRELSCHRGPKRRSPESSSSPPTCVTSPFPLEIRKLGRTGEVKRVAFGMTNFRHWRIRVLLYAGRPDWSTLSTVTPLESEGPESRAARIGYSTNSHARLCEDE